eukprot:416734_1
MAISQPNHSSEPIVIGVCPIIQQTWSHEQVLKLQDKKNWLVSDTFISFTTRRRPCIKEKCAPWIENISVIKRQLGDDPPREYFEARITFHLRYEYIQYTSLPGIAKLIKQFISEDAAKIMTNNVAHGIPNKGKNYKNQYQIKSIKIFFQTSYPTEVDKIVNILSDIQSKILDHEATSQFLFKYQWHTFHTADLPIKFRVTLPDAVVLAGPDIKDARNQMKLFQYLYANIPDANPENCAVSMRINPNNGKYNTTSIHLCCNYIPWDMDGRRVIEVYNWYFEEFRWPNLRIEITHINSNGIKYNKKALIHNDGITSAFDKYIQLQSKVIAIAESIYRQAVFEYRETKRDEYLFKEVERNIIRVFANKLEKDVTPTQVLNLGIHKRFWREITPSGTTQSMRKIKIILDPKKNINSNNNEDDDIQI